VGREISRRRLKHRDQHLSVRLRGWGAGYGPRCNARISSTFIPAPTGWRSARRHSPIFTT
jgi:hypothetical protein